VQPKQFRWRAKPEVQDFGVIAEDIAALGLESLIWRDDQGRPDEVRYDRLVLYLIPVVRQQRAELNDLKARLDALERQLERAQ